MYTRPYDDNAGIIIPESYSGTALREEPPISETHETEQASATPRPDASGGRNPWEKDTTVHNDSPMKNDKAVPTGSFLSNLPFGNLLGGIFKNERFGLQKIGTEEILIIATAAFLLFSKDGDKECAIMLLLLLFLA